MQNIKIGETIFPAKLTQAGDTLGLCFEGETIEHIAALLADAQEIRVLTQEGGVKAIYKNHALVRVYGETVAGKPRIHAAMKTELIEQKEAEALRGEIALAKAEMAALRENLALAKAQMTCLQEDSEMITGCLLEMSEVVYA